MGHRGPGFAPGVAHRVACLALLGALLAGCQLGAPTPVPTPTPVPGPTDAPIPPQDPIQGVVTHVESTGLNSVTGFTLRAIDGKTYIFTLGRLQNGNVFPPGHLAEHAGNSEPILVTFEAFGPTLLVIRLDDANPLPTVAPAPSATPAASSPAASRPAPTGTPRPS